MKNPEPKTPILWTVSDQFPWSFYRPRNFPDLGWVSSFGAWKKWFYHFFSSFLETWDPGLDVDKTSAGTTVGVSHCHSAWVSSSRTGIWGSGNLRTWDMSFLDQLGSSFTLAVRTRYVSGKAGLLLFSTFLVKKCYWGLVRSSFAFCEITRCMSSKNGAF